MRIRPELRKGVDELSAALQTLSSAERRARKNEDLTELRRTVHQKFEKVIGMTVEARKRLSAQPNGMRPSRLFDDVSELLDMLRRQFNDLPGFHQRMLPRILDDCRYELESAQICGREVMPATTNRIAEYFPQTHVRENPHPQWAGRNRISKFFENEGNAPST
ncbi:MAG: hypothetical protein PHE68_05435 [Candidatus Peribacteraceae bacterium]|nr:hypothetical protein [Candidatus Peribacteraceae bacterium]MDD5074486.1 hypothetical protein [Candidatus Peribacteraceae bacterium]